MKRSGAGIFCTHLNNACERKFAPLTAAFLGATFFQTVKGASAIFVKGGNEGIWQHEPNREQVNAISSNQGPETSVLCDAIEKASLKRRWTLGVRLRPTSVNTLKPKCQRPRRPRRHNLGSIRACMGAKGGGKLEASGRSPSVKGRPRSVQRIGLFSCLGAAFDETNVTAPLKSRRFNS